jgi:hypothetical protein
MGNYDKQIFIGKRAFQSGDADLTTIMTRIFRNAPQTNNIEIGAFL